jgi:FkbM family methyltransferase
MKRIFVDCGTHLFQGFCDFVQKYKIDETWECYSFEANPNTFRMSQEKYLSLLLNEKLNIKHYNQAISNKTDKIKVNCSKDSLGDVSQASNTLINPPDYDKQWKNSFEYSDQEVYVDAIDFSKFLTEISTSSDFVLVKMDIEGSEFDVIESLIETGSYKLIDEFYCEFHERFFEPQTEYEDKKEYFKKIFLENNIEIKEWF